MSYIIRVLQIKITMKCHIYLLKWLKSKTLTTLNAGKDGAKQSLIHCWWECKMILATLVDSLVVSYKAKHGAWAYDPAMVLLGIYLNELKTVFMQKLHINVYSSFMHNYSKLEACKMSFSRWMDKLWDIHILE